MTSSNLLSFLLILLFFTFQSQGLEGVECSVKDIEVVTRKTGRTFEDRPEYEVTVNNRCGCAQGGVKIRCVGFASYKPVDGRMMKQIGNGQCLVNGGRPISPTAPVKFTFAFLTPFDLIPFHSRSLC